MSLISRIQPQAEIRFKISKSLLTELENLKKDAKELGLSLNLDSAFEQNLRKLVNKIRGEMTDFMNQKE
ncbi:MAG: hypothetical protein E6Q32_08170 [Neisseriales bacterium]|jgi:hypothetical protein|nr:MAG: hypothetical protein E6Q32_08170 [Neisseriales bacterium]